MHRRVKLMVDELDAQLDLHLDHLVHQFAKTTIHNSHCDYNDIGGGHSSGSLHKVESCSHPHSLPSSLGFYSFLYLMLL